VLGDRFAAEVRLAIRRILETPERWGVLEDEVRRCAVRVFPYRVLYTIEPDGILRRRDARQTAAGLLAIPVGSGAGIRV
jgi:hypothetical protein